jgi:CheY-like chemotaxis protein
VGLHGGTIQATNNPGARGLRVTVKIPALTEASLHDPASEPAAPRSAASVTGLRVLLIDDDSEARVVLEHILGERGTEVKLADSAQHAREALETFTPDVIICDVGMPDGLEFIRRLRALPPERGGRIPAAALTAYVDEGIREGVLAAGFQMHLTKPIDIDALVAAVATLARSARGG